MAIMGDTVDEYIGKDGNKVQIPDPFRFLEQDSEQTKHWIEAEQNITSSFFEKCDIREQLTNQLFNMTNFTKIGTPKKVGEFFYFNYGEAKDN